MMRPALALTAVALALGLLGLPHVVRAGATAQPRPPPVVDLHVDLSYQVSYQHQAFAHGSGQYVASRLVPAGVAGVVLPLFVPNRVSLEGPRVSDLEASFERVVSLIPRTPPYALPGCRASENGTRPVRTWLSFEGAAPLASDGGSVATWVARGVRVFGLVHTSDNRLATSSGNVGPSAVGLTDAGRELVQRIFAAGAVVDVSHASDAATDEMIRLGLAAGKPVIATHSNARALTPHPRNLTDEQIRGVAATGGVVGVNLHSRFLVPSGRAHLADVVRQVQYLVRIAGPEHVAIGSDFEGDITPPSDLASVEGFPRLAAALAAAGAPRDVIAQVFGGNALRVLCPPGASSLK